MAIRCCGRTDVYSQMRDEFLPCANNVALYRQCPDGKCKKEIGFCAGCGGDDKAQVVMQRHIASHKNGSDSGNE